MNRTTVILLAAVGALVALGFTMQTSALMLKPVEGSSWEVHPLVLRQAAATLLGFALLIALARLDYRRLEAWTPWIYGAILVVLAMTLSPLGRHSKGAQRWLFGVQPSDFAKPVLLIALAREGSQRAHAMGRFWSGALRTIAVAAGPLCLILAEPDKGTTALLAAVAGLVMLNAGVRFTHLIVPAVLLAAGFAALIESSDYARKRWESFIDPTANRDARFQVQQGLYAFGAGGAEGAGLGRGAYKFNIPEQNTDFILPVVGEELGLPFTLGVAAAYALVLLCGMSIAARAPDRFGRLMASGVALLICAQAIVNMGVVTDLLPNKGMPLPFVSRGGSGMISMLTMVGMLVSVSTRSPAVPSRVKSAPRSNPFYADNTEAPA